MKKTLLVLVVLVLCNGGCNRARFADNGDGTITDHQTGLMWEKKSDNGDIHDKDNEYTLSAGTWLNTTGLPDGTAFTEFLAVLNSGSGFAGYTDWRLPTTEELVTLRAPAGEPYSKSPLATYSAFQQGSVKGCDAQTFDCSWTCSSALCTYWSSTTNGGGSFAAWIMSFADGSVMNFSGFKTNSYAVRAVRAGS